MKNGRPWGGPDRVKGVIHNNNLKARKEGGGHISLPYLKKAINGNIRTETLTEIARSDVV